MTMLTSVQHQAIARAASPALAMTDPQTNTEYMLVRTDIFREMRQRLGEDDADREERAFLKAAKSGARGRLLTEADS